MPKNLAKCLFKSWLLPVSSGMSLHLFSKDIKAKGNDYPKWGAIIIL